MGEVVKGKFGRSARRAKVERSSLCEHGHHQWRIDKTSRFDAKQGKLVTVSRCVRCGQTKTVAK